MGPTGPTGAAPDINPIAAATAGSSPSATITVTGTASAPTFKFDFTLPQGPTGPTGATGGVGPTGPTGISITLKRDQASCTQVGDCYIQLDDPTDENYGCI